jgi:hypothetical protein
MMNIDRAMDSAIAIAVFSFVCFVCWRTASVNDALTANLDYPPLEVEDVAAPGVRHELATRRYYNLEPITLQPIMKEQGQ